MIDDNIDHIIIEHLWAIRSSLARHDQTQYGLHRLRRDDETKEATVL